MFCIFNSLNSWPLDQQIIGELELISGWYQMFLFLNLVVLQPSHCSLPLDRIIVVLLVIELVAAACYSLESYNLYPGYCHKDQDELTWEISKPP